MIRVLVAEDSSTARALIVEMLNSDAGRLVVVGEAANGLEAVEMTRRLRPDVVTMDIRMPALDGLEAIRRIMTEVPTPVVVISSCEVLEVETSLEALRAGALAVLEKPEGPGAPGFEERRRALVETVRLMAAVKVVRRFPSRPSLRAPSSPRAGGRHVRAVAIGTSTGGPAALNQILSHLPADFPAPILVVQHISEGFIFGLARWLAAGARLAVKIAEPGEAAAPGTVYLAPDDKQLGLTPSGRVVISDAKPVEGFRPSATYLFESVAAACGAATLAVILTGMGRDGVEGLRKVKAAGGRVLAQDEASAVIFGMPAAAIEAGLADEVLPLDDLAQRMVELTTAVP